MKILLNEQEQEALTGLPLLAFCLYVKAIKPRMDIATSLVGAKYRISWQALTEWLYVEPHPGIKSGSPSINQLRRAVFWLQKSGLIQNLSKKKQLVFKCLLAASTFYNQNKADSNPTDKRIDLNYQEMAQITEDDNASPLEVNKATSEKADIHLFTRTDTTLNPCEPIDSNFSFDEKTIPSDTRHWTAFFIHNLGFDPLVVHTIKTLTLFEHWCKEQISIGLVKQAVNIAHNVLGRRPDSPTYYRNFVEEWLSNQQKLNTTRFKSYPLFNQERRYDRSKPPRTAAERMWSACEAGLEGTVFEPDLN